MGPRQTGRRIQFPIPMGWIRTILQSITDQYGTIDKDQARQAGYVIEDAEAWIKKDVDVLIPGALEGQVNAESVKRVSDRVKIVAEGANGPTTPEADEIFKRNNVFVIPDFLCNAGGVTVSYFEGVQNDMNYYWTREEVLERLDTKMTAGIQKRARDVGGRESLYARCGVYGGNQAGRHCDGAARLDLDFLATDPLGAFSKMGCWRCPFFIVWISIPENGRAATHAWERKDLGNG